MSQRIQKIIGDLDLSSKKVIEIGALDSPMFTRDNYNVRYIDYASTENLKANHIDNPFVRDKDIVDVDVVWSPGHGDLSALLDDEVDFVFASHVIEHVPDLVTWFKEIAKIIRIGGVFSLIVPDRNKTFDCLRVDSNTAEVIDAYVRKITRPTYKHIFEYYADHAADETGGLFPDGDNTKARRVHTLQESYDKVMESYNNGSYIDSHCWVFTSPGLLGIMMDLMELGLFDFKVKEVYQTEDMEIDFFLTLEKINIKDGESSKEIQIQSAKKHLNQFPVVNSRKSSNAYSLQNKFKFKVKRLLGAIIKKNI